MKFTSCLPMVGGSLRLLPSLKLVAMILLKVALNTKNQIKSIICYTHICTSHVSFLLNKLIYPKANHLKLMHKVRDHLRKVKFNFKLCNIFHSGMFCSDLWHVGGFLRVLQVPPAINVTSQYMWNICESDVKHHSPSTFCDITIYMKYLWKWC